MKQTAEENELWERFQRDPSVRDEVIEFYYPYACRVAGSMAANVPTWVSQDELVSVGAQGLIKAVDRYRPDDPSGTPFRVYALQVIRGSVLDWQRSEDWAPRSLRSDLRAVREAEGRVRARTSASPDPQDVADELGWDPEDVAEVHRLQSRADVASLNQHTEEGTELGDLVVGQDDVSELVAEVVGKWFDSLSFPAQYVLSRVYVSGDRVADVEGVPKAREVHTEATVSIVGVLRQLA